MSLLGKWGSSGSDKAKDDVRKINEQLCQECSQVQEEYKRLREVVNQLSREYETSKDIDLFRRYGMMKGMVKRSVLHIKLEDDANHAPVATGGDVRQKEEMRKQEEHLRGMTQLEITAENDKLTEQIKEYRRKISMIKDLIVQMERQYLGSKRYIVIQRYGLIKNMIKTVTHNKWI